MPEKKKINTVTAEDDIVRLKPILGIKPGHYLAFLYGLVILLILFFIFLYPGLSNPGSVLSVKSEPAGAAVRVDGLFMGTAPSDIFVTKGKHQIEVVLPGFTDWRGEMEFGSQIFGSLFFPKKMPLKVELKAPNPIGAFRDEAAEYAAWTFIGEATASYQVPMVLSEAAYRLGPAASNPLVRKEMEDILTASAGFAHTRSGLRDLVRAKFLLDNQGLAASPLTLLDSIEDIINFLETNPGAAAWLGATLQGDAASTVRASSWYRNTAQTALQSSTGRTVAGYGLQFREITVTELNQPDQAMIFYIAETPVSLDLWDIFISERPEWQKENRDFLIGQGLVDSQYMASLYVSGQPQNTVSWISWYAARAFCEWYNTKINARDFIPAGDRDAELRLPTEDEWELAAKAGIGRVGEFWEWCDNSFYPLGFLPISASLESISPQRSVRGGSWVNPQTTVSAETRGSLLPDSCSPFVSFRPVIAVKRN
ncbi:MAG: SUMF1/EgtB/PvdO family nonheme iron enzyme [Treponema sp.]|nr:SUMF1/EgtB/PvdO family nonheme iron enzyme [Treponema sp.]